MQTTQQYRLQSEKMTELLNFLGAFNESMEEKIRYYRQRTEEMFYDGLPQETYNKLTHIHINETNHLVRNVIEFNEETTRPFVLANMENIEEQIKLNS